MRNDKNDTLIALEPTNEQLVEIQNSLEDVAIDESDEISLVDGMKSYLDVIGKIPLLSAEEERELSQVIISNGKDSKNAQDKLVLANLRLVISIARRYIGRGVEFQDLNGMGCEGLIKAAQKYDYRVGCRFSTYATWWIKQAIVRGIADEESDIRIPVHMRDCMYKISKAKNDYYQKNGVEASIENICDITGYSVEKVKAAESLSCSIVSFDVEIGEDGDATLKDYLADMNAIDPYETSFKGELQRTIIAAIKELNDREARVICLYYGIGYDREWTLEQIANLPDIKLTRERVRQIKEKALKKLRTNHGVIEMHKEYVA